MIQIKNAPKNYKREDVLSRAVGVTDSNGNPTKWITLDRASNKPVANGTMNYGYDSTIIEIGRNGMSITHRSPGYAEWHTDPLSGNTFTIIGHTPNNIKHLAATIGENLWRIRESDIEREVKAEEDRMMQELKAKLIHLTDETGEPMFDNADRPVTVNAYDNLMAERKKGRKVKAGIIFDPRKAETNDLSLETARRDKLVAELRKQNEELEAQLAMGNQKRQSLIQEGAIDEPSHTREELEAIKPFAALKATAKKDYKVDETDVENMSKADIINKIMEIQEARKQPEKVE